MHHLLQTGDWINPACVLVVGFFFLKLMINAAPLPSLQHKPPIHQPRSALDGKMTFKYFSSGNAIQSKNFTTLKMVKHLRHTNMRTQ